MKKLLLLLLCVPLIGFGQVKVINSNSEPITIGLLPNATISDGEKLQSDGNSISLLYDNSSRFWRMIYWQTYDYKYDTKVDIFDEGNTLNDLYSIIIDGFASLPKKNDIVCQTKEGSLLPISKCEVGFEYYIVNEVTLDIGNSNLLTLQWIGNKKRKVGQIRFVYKDNYSRFLRKKEINQLFNK